MTPPTHFLFLRRLARFSLISAAAFAATSNAWAQLYADFETSMGHFTVELFYREVPRTVANFVGLAEGTRTWLHPATLERQENKPFYDGLIITRVVKNFVIQGGAPLNDRRYGPGYTIPNECVKSPTGELLYTHTPGVISMANSGPNTNGSQFFITATGLNAPHLDDNYTVFGKIADGPYGTAVQGMAVVDAINAVPTAPDERPLTDVVVQKVRIRRMGPEAEAFDVHAWQLPEIRPVTQDLFHLTYAPPTAPGGDPEVTLHFTPTRGARYILQDSHTLQDWTTIYITNVAASSAPQSLRVTGLANTPTYYIRAVTEVDSSQLFAATMPEFSSEATLELRFTSPAVTVRVQRAANAGTWTRTAPSAASGALSSFTYVPMANFLPQYSPGLELVFAEPLPWTENVSLNRLQLTLTFNAGATPSIGYFNASGATTANAEVTAKGIFQVLTP